MIRWSLLLLLAVLWGCQRPPAATTTWPQALHRIEGGAYSAVRTEPNHVVLERDAGERDIIPYRTTRGWEQRRQELDRAVRRARAAGHDVTYD